jgi:hypothetical protein
MYIVYTNKYIYALFHLYTNVWTILNINSHLNDYTSYMNSNLFLPSKRISLPTLYLFLVTPPRTWVLMFHLSFFFQFLLGVFLKLFNWFFEVFVIWYCTFFNVGVFSWVVKVCSFELLCTFSSLIFQFMLEFLFKLINDWTLLSHTFFEVTSFAPLNFNVPWVWFCTIYKSIQPNIFIAPHFSSHKFCSLDF